MTDQRNDQTNDNSIGASRYSQLRAWAPCWAIFLFAVILFVIATVIILSLLPAYLTQKGDSITVASNSYGARQISTIFATDTVFDKSQSVTNLDEIGAQLTKSLNYDTNTLSLQLANVNAINGGKKKRRETKVSLGCNINNNLGMLILINSCPDTTCKTEHCFDICAVKVKSDIQSKLGSSPFQCNILTADGTRVTSTLQFCVFGQLEQENTTTTTTITTTTTTTTANIATCGNLTTSCSAPGDCCSPNYNCGGSTCCAVSGVTCSTSADCCNYLTCNGVCCGNVGDTCTANSDCCSGYTCIGGYCNTPTCSNLGVSCSAPGDCCAPNYMCAGPTCCGVGGATCSVNADCCNPYTCDSGHCASCPGAPCTTNSDCCSGYTCTGSYCNTPSCNNAGASCSGPSDCCAPNYYCIGPTCCSAHGVACASASDCCLPYACNAGSCS